ncbi:hypothetical protein CTAM01_17194, partial [Colletotrichum tamarilloi]
CYAECYAETPQDDKAY